MQLHDLIKPIEEQSDEELLERLRKIRHTRSVVRPAAVKHKVDAEKKKTRSTTKKVENLLDALSPAEREALIKQLEG